MDKQNFKTIGISGVITVSISLCTFIFPTLNLKYRVVIIAGIVAGAIIINLAILLHREINANRHLADPLNEKIKQLLAQNKEDKRHFDNMQEEYKTHIKTLEAQISLQKSRITQVKSDTIQQSAKQSAISPK
ncbi:hypothetical protein [Loigolactobacillus coryniformis]|uniref:hypothetical protein n=1 Tax=Loigolactobacillus coryniformis TaxID=1610 RepID=UPI001C606668|nr:hypothetical protein [Loigolactobacillus coryniformis]MBW4802895.1 hypothetical protein [Loigolactobacillus coryniformis subsp. torquens]MBW4805593.1 hypothetical protein [Loigolactobacillus coryniformis subsp. torquens]